MEFFFISVSPFGNIRCIYYVIYFKRLTAPFFRKQGKWIRLVLHISQNKWLEQHLNRVAVKLC